MAKNDTKLSSYLNDKTDNPLLTTSFSIDDIAKMLQNLDPNKVHGHDKISVRMLPWCGNSVLRPLELILKQFAGSASFSSEWKKMECNSN